MKTGRIVIVDDDNLALAIGKKGLNINLANKLTKYNIDIKFVLAQGEVESHFGTKGMASKTNSVWNVGAFDGYDLKHIRTKYNNPNQSIEPYLILLNKKYLINKIELDFKDCFDLISLVTLPRY